MTNERTAVLAANQAFYEAFERQDIDAMSTVWSQGTGSLCIHPGRHVLSGWQAIQLSWEQIFRKTNSLEIEIDIISTEIRNDIAYVILIETIRQISGRKTIQAQSMATNIFERMASSWYLVHHHGSPLMR